MAQTKHPKCYLCGEALSAPINRDHVPPRRFFAPELRKKFKVTELITLPTHVSCNERWRLRTACSRFAIYMRSRQES